jgi:transposase
MAYNFLRGDRDQPFLLPPDLRDWLPAGHLAWFILDVVDQLDLEPFYRVHRDDGHGHPAYDPKTLLGVLLYGYCIGVRASRQLERRCHEDLAFRVLAGNQLPDHVTIARFRVRHQTALAGFLVASLTLCAAAGLVRLGVVALDGTKVAANAANTASHTHDKIEAEVAQILRQAAEADQRDDREHGAARGDELPEALASKAGRLARLRQAKAQLEAEAAERQRRYRQRVAELAAAAQARGKQPPAHIKPRRRDEASNPKATANLTQIPDAPELLIPPARHGRQGKPRKDGKPTASRSDGLRAAMSAKLASEDGKACYAKRNETIEPVFGQLKERQGARRFLRRGLAACDAEWKLLCGTHNLLKLWRHQARPPSASPATT